VIDSAAASPLTHSPAGSGNVLLENLSATQMLTLTPTVTGGTQLLSISLAAGSIHAAAGGIVISANLGGSTFTKTVPIAMPAASSSARAAFKLAMADRQARRAM
jgi:subtilase family serine protease